MLADIGARHLLELYCGVGVFSLAAAGVLPDLRAEGVELDPRSIGCARRNAKARHVSDRCRFVVGNAEKRLDRPEVQPDAVLVDPPRRGLSPRLIEALKRWRVPHVIYVSCAPDTLARDLRRLCVPGGYELRSARLFDMFPRTAHFETLCVLARAR